MYRCVQALAATALLTSLLASCAAPPGPRPYEATLRVTVQGQEPRELASRIVRGPDTRWLQCEGDLALNVQIPAGVVAEPPIGDALLLRVDGSDWTADCRWRASPDAPEVHQYGRGKITDDHIQGWYALESPGRAYRVEFEAKSR